MNMPASAARTPAAADNPITSIQHDRLGRAARAERFAKRLLSVDSSSGLVVGVLGRWGTGKSSFLNLAASTLREEGVDVLHFNPWMFSGAEALLVAFFDELAAQLRMKKDFSDLAEQFETYGDAASGLDWVPVAGSLLRAGGQLSKLLGARLKVRQRGLAGKRSRIEETLRQLGKPIVVIVDDVDRLTSGEIRDIFKLVRLTAQFPSVIYVLAFDRERVEKALSEEQVEGRAYLEKILQLSVDLPEIPRVVLRREVFAAIELALEGLPGVEGLDSERWPEVFFDIIDPLIGTMRDVRRYAIALSATVEDMEGHVQLADVLALEAVRIFMPDVHVRLHGMLDALTSTSGMGSREQLAKDKVLSLIEVAGSRGDVARSMITRLFPGAERHLGKSTYASSFEQIWRQKRRVAHVDLLRFYLERVVGDGLAAFLRGEQAFQMLSDPDGLASVFSGTAPEAWPDVISSLEAHEEQFERRHVEGVATILLNCMPAMPDREDGLFVLEPNVVVARVVYRLLKKCDGPKDVASALGKIIPGLRTLYAKFELITLAGSREGRGQKLIDEHDEEVFERDLFEEIRELPYEDWAAEPKIFWLVSVANSDADRRGLLPVRVPDAPSVTLAVLLSARTESRSQKAGSYVVEKRARLPWEDLIKLFEGEAVLRERLAQVSPKSESEVSIVALTLRYLSGWRPQMGGDD